MKLKEALKAEYVGYKKEILGKVKQKALDLIEGEVKVGLVKLGAAIKASDSLSDDSVWLFVGEKLMEIADKINGKKD